MILILLHALEDSTLEDLGNKTPLEAADTPNLDALQFRKVAPPSHLTPEASVYSLLGVTEGLENVSKAALEAYAMGLNLEADQVVFSCRFVPTAEGVVIEIDPKTLSNEEGKALCQNLESHFEGTSFVHMGGANCLVITDRLPGSKWSHNPALAVGKAYDEILPESTDFLREISELLSAHEINALRTDLEQDPINALLLMEGGQVLPLPEMRPKSGIYLITQERSIEGLAKTLDVPCTYLKDERMRFAHIDEIIDMLPSLTQPEIMIDLHYLRYSTEAGQLLEKVKTIEWLDKKLLGPLRSGFGDENLEVLALTPMDIRSGELVG